MSDGEMVDVTRRTRLAAERTWLAWWRTGIAASAAALAVGALVPQLVEAGLLSVGTIAVVLFAER
jgi:putative membrane protein